MSEDDQRIEVITGTPRRRRWTTEQKLRIIEESFEPGETVSSVARHNRVARHKGPYLGYLRYHLGIVVPTANPLKFIVADQAYTWREGEAVLFDDTWPHEVVNDSDSMRIVLIVDVLRPLPPVPHMVNRLVTNFIAKHTYGRAIRRRVDIRPIV